MQLQDLKGLMKLLHLLSAALTIHCVRFCQRVQDQILSACVVLYLQHVGHLSDQSLAAWSKTCMPTGLVYYV